MGGILTTLSMGLELASFIPGPYGAACGMGAKIVDGAIMVIGGAPISTAIKSTVKNVVVAGALSFTGAKAATAATKAYGAAKGIQIAQKGIENSRQIIQGAKKTGKAIDRGVRGAINAFEKLNK